MRILKKLISARLILLVGVFVIFSPALLRGDVYTYTVSTCIDGEDYLISNSSGLQWQYWAFDPVGTPRGDCYMPNTEVSSTLNGVPYPTQEFYPSFSPPYPGALSQVFTLSPAFPSDITSVSLDVLAAGWILNILQVPNPSNGETLILDFNDNAPGGAHYYSAEVTIDTPSSTVPEPGTLVLVSTGLLGGIGAIRRRLRLRK